MRKTALLFSLYFCQGLPGGFLAVVFPVILREQGASYTKIGSTALLSLPWVLKFLWAPLADRWFLRRFGRRRSWIIPAQAGMVLTTIAIAVLTPQLDLLTLGLAFFLLNLFAATQDIGVDGLAVDILPKKELGTGNAAQVSGFKIGNIMGGGILLSLIGIIGWMGDFAIMAALVAGVMIFMLLTKEEPLYVGTRSVSPPGYGDLWRALATTGVTFWIFLFYAKFGESFGGVMIKPLLYDLGFSKGEIGTLDGTIGGICTVLGGVAAGLTYRWAGLRWTFGIFAVLQGTMLITFGIASTGPLSFTAVALLNGLENFAGGGVGVCVFILAMSTCRPETGAAQFTAAQCLYMSGLFAAGPMAGLWADLRDPHFVLVTGGIMAVSLAAILALWAPRPLETRPESA